MCRRRKTRKHSPASPTSASGSTWRLPSACRSCRATAPISSARLRAILGNRPDIRIVGDRFVFQSEVFFDAGKATLHKAEGRAELDGLAAALLELEKQIPGEIAWVLRVDGHTDVRPIISPQFKCNWALSAGARDLGGAVSHPEGVSPQRLVAAGFGEFQPIDHETTARTPIAATVASSSS